MGPNSGLWPRKGIAVDTRACVSHIHHIRIRPLATVKLVASNTLGFSFTLFCESRGESTGFFLDSYHLVALFVILLHSVAIFFSCYLTIHSRIIARQIEGTEKLDRFLICRITSVASVIRTRIFQSPAVRPPPLPAA